MKFAGGNNRPVSPTLPSSLKTVEPSITTDRVPLSPISKRSSPRNNIMDSSTSKSYLDKVFFNNNENLNGK